jgi:hypothetical protein
MASVGGDMARDHRDDSTIGLGVPSSTWMELLAPGDDNFPCSAHPIHVFDGPGSIGYLERSRPCFRRLCAYWPW